MNNRTRLAISIVLTALIGLGSPLCSWGGELITRDCSELIRLAQSYQDDLKTVDTVLGSAIDAGTLERVKKYKLKRAEVKKHLGQVMHVINIKGCVK